MIFSHSDTVYGVADYCEKQIITDPLTPSRNHKWFTLHEQIPINRDDFFTRQY